MPAPIGNKFAVGLTNNGRPPIFESPEAMQKMILGYLESCNPIEEKDGEETITFKSPITITGLCLYLGFESRQSFYDYEKNEDFSYIIKRARLVIENAYEEGLFYKSPTGPIFALKNMGWHDKTETEHSGEIKTTPTTIVFTKPTNE